MIHDIGEYSSIIEKKGGRGLVFAAAVIVLCAHAQAQPSADLPIDPGEMAVTCYSGSNPGSFGLGVFDVRDPVNNSPGKNQNWSDVPIYHDASWTRTGFDGEEVFGLALDDDPDPNIYVTATTSYNGIPGRPSRPASGKIFKIGGGSGAVSVFQELKKANGDPLREGLGNIAFDPLHRQLFVTNFHDGKIYRLSFTGQVEQAYDPAIGATNPAPSDPGYAPLGERLWGIGVHEGERRVYFSVWIEDTRVNPDRNNEIWSVEMDAAGAMVPGSEVWELSLPLNSNRNTSMPVADIAFSVDGRMLLAERSMKGDEIVDVHQSRVLEFEGRHGSWIPATTLNGATKPISIGVGAGQNSAGGVSYVCSQGTVEEWILSTADALALGSVNIYGVQILPNDGGAVTDSYLVDVDRETTSQDKRQIGDVEAFNLCGDSCLEILVTEILCTTDGSGDFIFRFRVRNTSGDPAYHLYFTDQPGITVTPSYVNLTGEPGGFLPSQEVSAVKEVRIRGAQPGSMLDLQVSIHDELLAECCAIEHRIELPACDCAQVIDEGVSCTFFGPNPTFTYRFTLENLNPTEVSFVLATSPSSGVAIGQQISLSPPRGFGGRFEKSVSITGAKPGDRITLRLSTHDIEFDECCSIEHEIDLPERCFFNVTDTDVIDYNQVGGATLLYRDGALEVGNIGASGEDGVRLDFAPAGGIEAKWRPLVVPDPLPDATFLRFTSRGLLAGDLEQRVLGELRFTETGFFREITADYSSIGSPTQRLEVYRQGELVEVVEGHSGLVARVTEWPTGCGKTEVVIDGIRTACYWPMWDHDLTLDIPGLGPVTGDSLRVIAEAPAHALGALESFSVQAAGIPTIFMTGATASFDCNDNGVADEVDIANGASADLNRNFVPDECEDLTGGVEVVLNTGFDETEGTILPAGRLPNGTADDDWRVAAGDRRGAAKVVRRVDPGWRAALDESAWISVNPARGASVPGIETLVFETCFCLGEDASAATLDVEYRADDVVSAFRLNGGLLNTESGRFSDPAAGQVRFSDAVGTGLFKVGVNCIQVEVLDDGRVVTGLNLAGSVKSDGAGCEP